MALENERRTLLKAHYAGAAPLTLLKEEQDRISKELAAAQRIVDTCSTEYETMLANLDTALALLADPYGAYLKSNDDQRRVLNQTLAEKLFLIDDRIVGADLAAPYVQLLDDNLEDRIAREQAAVEDATVVATASDPVSYEVLSGTEVDETARALLAQIDWNRKERPLGALPVDLKNPRAYLRHRCSNKTLLAEGGGFEPPGPVKAQ